MPYLVSFLALQLWWWERERCLLYFELSSLCFVTVIGAFSQCHWMVCSVWLWYFLLILTYILPIWLAYNSKEVNNVNHFYTFRLFITLHIPKLVKLPVRRPIYARWNVRLLHISLKSAFYTLFNLINTHALISAHRVLYVWFSLYELPIFIQTCCDYIINMNSLYGCMV